MPASIATLDECKADLGIKNTDEDVIIQRLLDEQTEWIESTIGRFILERLEVIEYYASPTDRKTLVLDHRPITQTTDFELYIDSQRAFGVDTLLTEDEEFVVDLEAGIVELVGSHLFIRGPKTIKVKYSAGYVSAAMPQGLKNANIYLTGYFYQKYNDRTSLMYAGKSIADGNVTIIDGIPKTVWDILHSYTLQGVG